MGAPVMLRSTSQDTVDQLSGINKTARRLDREHRRKKHTEYAVGRAAVLIEKHRGKLRGAVRPPESGGQVVSRWRCPEARPRVQKRRRLHHSRRPPRQCSPRERPDRLTAVPLTNAPASEIARLVRGRQHRVCRLTEWLPTSPLPRRAPRRRRQAHAECLPRASKPRGSRRHSARRPEPRARR